VIWRIFINVLSRPTITSIFTRSHYPLLPFPHVPTTVSAAADRPARRSGSAHAKYFVSHRMVIKLFLLLGLAAEYRYRRDGCDQQLSDDHQKFMTLTGELS